MVIGSLGDFKPELETLWPLAGPGSRSGQGVSPSCEASDGCEPAGFPVRGGGAQTSVRCNASCIYGRNHEYVNSIKCAASSKPAIHINDQCLCHLWYGESLCLLLC